MLFNLQKNDTHDKKYLSTKPEKIHIWWSGQFLALSPLNISYSAHCDYKNIDSQNIFLEN